MHGLISWVLVDNTKKAGRACRQLALSPRLQVCPTSAASIRHIPCRVGLRAEDALLPLAFPANRPYSGEITSLWCMDHLMDKPRSLQDRLSGVVLLCPTRFIFREQMFLNPVGDPDSPMTDSDMAKGSPRPASQWPAAFYLIYGSCVISSSFSAFVIAYLPHGSP